jgi:hypothetical protein
MAMIAQADIARVVESFQLEDGFWAKGRNLLAVIAGIGWAGSAAAFATNPKQFYFSWLVAFSFVTTIALGALFFTMVQHLTGSAWSVTVRRLMENIASTIPAAAVLFIPVAVGLGSIYEWMNPAAVAHDHVLEGKAGYLNQNFFLLRAAVYFVIWSVFALRLLALSTAQDKSGAVRNTRAMTKWSAPGVLLSFLTVTLASFDWLMSLDPHWYSTIFGIYVYSGGAWAFFAVLALVALILRRAGYLERSVHLEHYQDLGKWMFALTIFWAYIAFSQYMLIWYANLPEETIWFRHRLQGSWQAWSALLLVGHFLIPFVLLLNRASKRNLKLLGTVAVWMLLMQFADLYWLVMPSLHPHGVALGWIDLVTLAATTGTMGLVFWFRMRRAAILPVGDPRLEKCLEFENV